MLSGCYVWHQGVRQTGESIPARRSRARKNERRSRRGPRERASKRCRFLLTARGRGSRASDPRNASGRKTDGQAPATPQHHLHLIYFSSHLLTFIHSPFRLAVRSTEESKPAPVPSRTAVQSMHMCVCVCVSV